MKSYESTLAFFHSRRLCRLLSSFSQPTVYSKHISILISLLSILSLISSVAAVPQQRIPSSSQTLTNGSSLSNPSRRRLLQPTILSSTSTSTSIFLTTTDEHNLNNVTNVIDKSSQKPSRTIAHIVIIIIICSFMSIVTVIGNLVVILAVCLVRKLQTASNILIVSLAVSDILVGLIVMPLAMVSEIFSGEWKLGPIMCDIWTSTDVLLCTSSILTFLVISIDRYCIINHPFKYAPMRKVKLLSLMIASVWILSALVSLPPILGWGRPSINLPICQVNPQLDYQIFATMLSFYIPLILVLIIYANIYRTAQTAMDNRSSVQMSQFLNNTTAATTNNNNHNSSSNVGQPTNVTTPLAQQQLNGNSSSTPHLLLNVSNTNSNPKPNNDDSGNGSQNSVNEQEHNGGRRSLRRSTTNNTSVTTPFNGRLSIFMTRRYSFFRHVHLPNQKAIRTLGVILGTFIVCWLPFMLFAIIKPLHETIARLTGSSRSLNVPGWVDSILLWFGYSSSMLNPIIYSKFNREFRTPFREIMCCRCKGLNEKIRRQEYLENLYGEPHLQVPNNPQHQLGAHTRASGPLEAAV